MRRPKFGRVQSPSERMKDSPGSLGGGVFDASGHQTAPEGGIFD